MSIPALGNLTTGLVWHTIVYGLKLYIRLLIRVTFTISLVLFVAFGILSGGNWVGSLSWFALVGAAALFPAIVCVVEFLSYIRKQLPENIRLRREAPFNGKILACACFMDENSAQEWFTGFGGELMERESRPFEAVRRREWVEGEPRLRALSAKSRRSGWMKRSSDAIVKEMARLGFNWYDFAVLDGIRIWFYTTTVKETASACVEIQQMNRSDLCFQLMNLKGVAESMRLQAKGKAPPPEGLADSLGTKAITMYLMQALYQFMLVDLQIPAKPSLGVITNFAWCDVTHHQERILGWLLRAGGAVSEVHFFLPPGCSPNQEGQVVKVGNIGRLFPFFLSMSMQVIETPRGCIDSDASMSTEQTFGNSQRPA